MGFRAEPSQQLGKHFPVVIIVLESKQLDDRPHKPLVYSGVEGLVVGWEIVRGLDAVADEAKGLLHLMDRTVVCRAHRVKQLGVDKRQFAEEDGARCVRKVTEMVVLTEHGRIFLVHL